LNEEQIRSTVELILSRPAHLTSYCARTGSVFLDHKRAAQDFFQRAAKSDISPVRFFDPGWFRTRYRVTGPNAFLSYLRDGRQRLAVPSAVFAPRWYARRYKLGATTPPLVDFLLAPGERDPHPLLDQSFLAGQSGSWSPGNIALEFLTDPERFSLKPHPLFDAPWYLDKNPDVVAAGMNPLEHYLRFGHAEGRAPNRLFSVKWYREGYLGRTRQHLDPLTSYVAEGFARGATPAPGLWTLAKPTIKLTEHGPAPYIESLRSNGSIYAALRHRPILDPGDLHVYMSGRVQDYNPSFPEHLVLLNKPRVALMYSPKCASARIVYWWLEQANLLDAALQFSSWSHSFENIYRMSRRYLEDALLFDPCRYQIYKFVRNPLLRAASNFTQVLRHPDRYGIPADKKRMSFLEFLEHVRSTAFFGNDFHLVPQLTKIEVEGKIRPRILKIEDGLARHFRFLERSHALPAATFENHPEIRQRMFEHTQYNRPTISVGPKVGIPFQAFPDYSALWTPDSLSKVYDLYRMDFEAYGYSADPPAR
jgi:hypothetical protein